jgi:hypothetical protein
MQKKSVLNMENAEDRTKPEVKAVEDERLELLRAVAAVCEAQGWGVLDYCDRTPAYISVDIPTDGGVYDLILRADFDDYYHAEAIVLMLQELKRRDRDFYLCNESQHSEYELEVMPKGQVCGTGAGYYGGPTMAYTVARAFAAVLKAETTDATPVEPLTTEVPPIHADDHAPADTASKNEQEAQSQKESL